jgi:hypothetical protein
LIEVAVREIAREVPDDGVKRLGPEELESVLPVFRVHQLGVGDDLHGQRLERLMELGQALALAIGHQAMELVRCIGITGDFVDVVVEGLGVLDVEGEGVILIVEFGKEVIPLHAELPGWPRPAWIV